MRTDWRRGPGALGAGTMLALAIVGSPVGSAPDAGARPMPNASAPPAARPAEVAGYLTANAMPDVIRVLGPPPPAGSGTMAGDLATYQATRRLEGTARWALATRDAEFGPAAIMSDYSCAMGLSLDPRSTPALFHLLSRVVVDSETAERPAKRAYQRPRPFLRDGGSICVKPEAWLRTSSSYPSGHSTFGWTVGLILQALAPDRATDILARARSYGESRVVCGVHYESDVQAGRMVALSLFTALEANAAFRADLARAQREIARQRPSDLAHTSECKVEAKAAADPVW